RRRRDGRVRRPARSRGRRRACRPRRDRDPRQGRRARPRDPHRRGVRRGRRRRIRLDLRHGRGRQPRGAPPAGRAHRRHPDRPGGAAPDARPDRGRGVRRPRPARLERPGDGVPRPRHLRGRASARQPDRAARPPRRGARAARDDVLAHGPARPRVLVFEDIHWAEEPLLDLIEHLAAWVKEAPLLLLCLARPELLDVRPTWGGGSVRSTAIELEPLAPADSAELVEALIAERKLPIDVDAVLAKTEGNPLFVEETIRALAEQDGGAERIPDTLQALIAARVDRLPAEQRVVLQRASVIGRIFWPGAIEHLSADLESPAGALEGLLLRDFVLPESRSSITGESAFKFKHVLIREVAYSGLSKAARAEYHARFAAWLSERTGEELLEIRAFHLDQAARLHEELDGKAPAELAEQAAKALARAGDRAMSRESFRTARKLFLRAVELGPTLGRRYSTARAAWRLG